MDTAKTEPRPVWTKMDDGWKVRIPKNWYDNYAEAGENAFPVFKANGEVKRVVIIKVSKPFKLDGVEYVIGTPEREARHARTYGRKRICPAHRCEECGSIRNVRQSHDMSGIVCWLCAKCDDGAASVC